MAGGGVFVTFISKDISQMLENRSFLGLAEELTGTVAFFSGRGWTPATSSNFSARIPGPDPLIAISKSGVDKSRFVPADVMIVDQKGDAVAPANARPSAETQLHVLLYERPAIGAVLHTHSVAGTVLSMKYKEKIEFRGFEILKGLAGNRTHDTLEVVPIFPNDQNMVRLAGVIREYWQRHETMQGFLIEGHGLYTWGRNIFEAKRQVETFEFLFECRLNLR